MQRLKVRVLGPVRLGTAGHVAPIASLRARTVLAALALRPGSVVPAVELVDIVWGDRAPRTAANQLQIAVFRLRQQIAAAGADPQASLLTHPTGYQLAAEGVDLDLAEFRRLADDAARLAGSDRLDLAAARYAEALALWAGRACQDVTAARIADATQSLEAVRQDTVERWLAVQLLLDRPVTSDANEYLATDPLRERLWYLSILGLARAGRTARALEEYQRARRTLAAELGLEPARELRELEQHILHGRTERAVDAVREWFPAARSAGVWQIPPDIPDFAGRTAELARVSNLLREEGPAVVCVSGMGGMGKTTLAVRVARALRDRYPDGCVFFDLRGTDAGPGDAHRIMGSILQSLGIPATEVPDDPPARASRFRSELARRRMLLVMDNAAGEAQVRPLIPAEPGSGMLVTSRRLLAGLDGCHHIDLDVLAPEESVWLLGTLAGTDRVSGEPLAAARLAELCGHLPLAVRIVGVRLARRPGLAIERMVDRLAGERSRLDELATGDREVRAVFALSYDRLEAPEATLLRRLGTAPLPETPLWFAAALLDRPVADAERIAERLADASLISLREDADGLRLRLHDLVHLYARSLATDDDLHALRRAYGVLAAYALRADRELPNRVDLSPAWPVERHVNPPAPKQPLRWFESHEALLIAAAGDAADHGWSEAGWRLAATMSGYIVMQSNVAEWRAVAERLVGMIPAPHEGRDALLLPLGQLMQSRGRLAESLRLLREARRGYARRGDEVRSAAAAVHLGMVYRRSGRFRAASAANAWALPRLERGGARSQLARVYLATGNLYLESGGDLNAAITAYERSLELMRATGDRGGEGNVLGCLGHVEMRAGRLTTSAGYFRQAGAVMAEVGDKVGMCMNSAVLAQLLVRLGDLDEAAAEAEAGLRMAVESQNSQGMRYAYHSAGMAAAARGDGETAVRNFTEAVALGRRTGPIGLAASLRRLALAVYDLGDHAAAQAYAEEARTIFASLGRADADEITRWLAAVRSTG